MKIEINTDDVIRSAARWVKINIPILPSFISFLAYNCWMWIWNATYTPAPCPPGFEGRVTMMSLLGIAITAFAIVLWVVWNDKKHNRY
jgi:hypothetical protein